VAANETLSPLPPVPGRVTALSSLPVDRNDPGRWITGYTFQPEACANGAVLSMNCLGDSASLVDTVGRPAVVNGSGWMVYAYDKCSTFGWEAAEYEARARRQLVANESWLFARELWTGAATGPSSTNSLPKNRPLADPGATAVTSGTAVTPLIALSLLEQALAQAGLNRRGFIHCRPQVLVHWASLYAVRREGGLWLTPMDNIVVTDGGYLGSSPAAPSTAPTIDQWAYATSWMQVRVGQTRVTGGPDPTGIDRTVNTVHTWAFEPVMVQWDQCVHYAAQVALAAGAAP
jgi:hypothetical protein